ncbi:MAG TPA: (d)CMP kinase [Vicinamibacteria bacterium]|nr:(d)CMP kinase [Vicinamibacteria bacterium]
MRDETVIAIDGPAGAGKTTAARALAAALGFHYIDTGATFRAVALKALRNGIDLDDGEALAELARQSKISFGGDALHDVVLDGEDVSEAIREQKISMASSRVSARPELRSVLVELWREMARGRAVVLEGRDIGTEVFPRADLKFFLDADQDERARRRFEERASEAGVTYEGVRNDLERRDRADRSREHAPLRRAKDALVVDTTFLSPRETLEKLIEVTRSRLGLP